MMRLGVVRGASRLAGLVRLGLAAGVAGLMAPASHGQEPARKKEPPTFTKDVAAILQAKCQNCHRRDHVGPFSLETYDQARKRAADIAGVVAERTPAPAAPSQHRSQGQLVHPPDAR